MTELTLRLLKVAGDSSNTSSECIIAYDRTVSYPGQPPCVMNFHSSQFGSKQFAFIDIWECLLELRKFLEKSGYIILCNGARIDTYPSGMSRNMGGGAKIYVKKMGEIAELKDLVFIFDEAEPDRIGTVDEQFAYHKKWVESVNNRDFRRDSHQSDS